MVRWGHPEFYWFSACLIVPQIASSRMLSPMRNILFLCLTIATACFATAPTWTLAKEYEPANFKFTYAGDGTQVVAHPAASEKQALAVDVSPKSGKLQLKLKGATEGTSPLLAGLYRVTFHARLHHKANDDLSRLVIGLKSGNTKEFVWTQFDSAADRFTPLEFEVLYADPFEPQAAISWRQVSFSTTEATKSIRPLETPDAPVIKNASKLTKKQAADVDDLLGDLENIDKVTPLEAVDYPAVLIDRLSFEPLSTTQFVAEVRPQFIHIYPGEKNPISATLVNLEKKPVTAIVKLNVLAGLDEAIGQMQQAVVLPAGERVTVTFPWQAGKREFGYEARVSLVVDDKLVHIEREYFSVSFPIWKTALQANGFITWYGREKDFPEHVARNRRNYLNVEEAFSWQPSSWTDLTPDDEHWWTGQNDFHNSLSGLKQWIDLSHREGIKMITYLWSSASGPSGMEWARQYPHLATHESVGLSTEFADVEDLRLQELTRKDERLWDLRSGIWNSTGVNRGMLEGIDLGMCETVASAKAFGWDGARYDSPPGWSAMGAETVHAEFKLLGIEALMQKLLPEYYEQRTGNWSGDAISVRNVRYARHLAQEHDPHFALSYNFGINVDENNQADAAQLKYFAECCREGGQIMQEEIRGYTNGPWRGYLDIIRKQAEITRRQGGYHTIVAPNSTNTVLRCYAPIFMFVGGSHPYLDFAWSQPSPGRYTQFMTRFGETCWSLDLAPTTAEAAGFSIQNDELLWWDDLLRQRELADGRTQWIVHLVSQPPDEEMAPKKPVRMTPWQWNLEISRQTKVAPTVWALSAEPTTKATQLVAEQSGNSYTVTLPEHHYWTVLVWTEGEAQEPAAGKVPASRAGE